MSQSEAPPVKACAVARPKLNGLAAGAIEFGVEMIDVTLPVRAKISGSRCLADVVPAQAGTHTPQQIERARRMGPGSSAGTTAWNRARTARRMLDAAAARYFPNVNTSW
jgi:hypothetical protein